MLQLHSMILTMALTAPAVAAPAQAPPTATWIATMDGLALSLVATLTDVAAQPRDAARAQRLGVDLATLRGLVRTLSGLHQLPDADPTLPLLVRELDLVVEDAARGDESRLEGSMLAVAWTCMACHTRGDQGSRAPRIALGPIDATLPADVRGVAFAATRRFDEARAAFGAAAVDEDLAAANPVRWQRAVRGALLIDLRVRHDAGAALRVADQVLLTPGGDALYEDAAAWRSVLLPWARSKQPFPRSTRALAAEAERLIAEIDANEQRDPANEILALQTTALGHALLMQSPPRALRAQTFSWLGQSYARLRDLDIWSLGLAYDARCVEADPHTALARSCYARWHDGALSTFTGSAGGGLPDELAARDLALRALAAARPTEHATPR